MINVVIPIAGKSAFFDSEKYLYPGPLLEINGKSMIQLVLENFKSCKRNVRFIFVLLNKDCIKYHIDNVIRLLTDNQCVIVRLDNETKGAACSALMAIDHINDDTPLIIANADQIIDVDLDDILGYFGEKDVDAGVICFESVHPRWSFVRIDENNKIVEVAEKRPISKNAIAGFYFFKKGKYFIDSAMKSIIKGADVNGIYYVAPVINEMVLNGMNLEIYTIRESSYHTFYTPQKIEEYEKFILGRNDK